MEIIVFIETPTGKNCIFTDRCWIIQNGDSSLEIVENMYEVYNNKDTKLTRFYRSK